MEALGAHVCDNLDAIARTAFRSDVQMEPPEEVPDNSESITSVGTRKVERKFAVRNVTELIVDDGQQADRGRKTRLNDVDGSVWNAKAAGRIERLPKNKRSSRELCNQKGECAIACDMQVCSFPTLSEQESSQTRQTDRGEIEVEEERRVRTNRMPVLPTDREKHEHESAHVANRRPCRTEDSRKRFGERVVVATSGHGPWIPCSHFVSPWLSWISPPKRKWAIPASAEWERATFQSGRCPRSLSLHSSPRMPVEVLLCHSDKLRRVHRSRCSQPPRKSDSEEQEYREDEEAAVDMDPMPSSR